MKSWLVFIASFLLFSSICISQNVFTEICQKPNDKNIIFNTSRSAFFLEEKLLYECKDGFETIERNTKQHSVCKEKGWKPKPECLPIQCEVPFLENGDIRPKEDQFLHKTVVQFSCQKGYTRVGPVSSQCYHFGWSPQPPTCQETVNSCQLPANISNGHPIGDIREEYQHGEKLEYECDVPFVVTGPKTIECVDGEWSSLPSCIEEEETCGPPPNIQNGFPLTSAAVYHHGETEEYQCKPRATIIGTTPAKCLHGEWELPSCIFYAAKCTRPKAAEFVPNVLLAKQFRTNDIATYRCGSKHHKTKCVDGTWVPKPECKEPCPPPPQLPNAIHRTELKKYQHGEEIRFRCKEHFLLRGPEKIACEDGKWQTPPRCLGT